MRSLYSFLLYLLTPAVLFRLLLRGFRAPAYWRRWPERFGFFTPLEASSIIWVHAVSVGEVQAAGPLVRVLRERLPDCEILITTTTPTGSQQVLSTYSDKVHHVYAPYDLPGAVARFFQRTRPVLALIMETEIWPNLFHACREHGVPLLLINARMSQRSFAGYQKLHGLVSETLRKIDMIAAQSPQDAQRLQELGAVPDNLRVTGSIKFDIQVPASVAEHAEALRQEWGIQRPVWIAASTHEGEEELVLKAFDQVRQQVPTCLLVLVPRHPERFAGVIALCQRAGYRVALRSTGLPPGPDIDVMVGDTMGELLLLYAAADVAFVGGSLVSVGGHNPLEPAALGKPILMGPYVFNFSYISELLFNAGAARQVRDVNDMVAPLGLWLTDGNSRHEVGDLGLKVLRDNQGAQQIVSDLLAPYLDKLPNGNNTGC